MTPDETRFTYDARIDGIGEKTCPGLHGRAQVGSGSGGGGGVGKQRVLSRTGTFPGKLRHQFDSDPRVSLLAWAARLREQTRKMSACEAIVLRSRLRSSRSDAAAQSGRCSLPDAPRARNASDDRDSLRDYVTIAFTSRLNRANSRYLSIFDQDVKMSSRVSLLGAISCSSHAPIPDVVDVKAISNDTFR